MVGGKQVFSKRFRDRDNRPAPMVKLSKKVNGTYYVVEAVPDSKAQKLNIHFRLYAKK